MDRPALERLTPAAVQSWAGSENLNENRPKALPHERAPPPRRSRPTFTDEEALSSTAGRPGRSTSWRRSRWRRSATSRLAYSPGVAVPVLAIAEDPDARLRVHVQGQPGGGDLERHRDPGPRQPAAPLASKPVMEGKAVLFKRFADVDAIDVEMTPTDPDEIITSSRTSASPTAASTSRTSRRRTASASRATAGAARHPGLPRRPARHGDHRAAGLINACQLTGREIDDVKVVLNGAGAAGIASLEPDQGDGRASTKTSSSCDRKGVLYRGRTEDMNQWKSAHAVDTDSAPWPRRSRAPTSSSASRPRAPSRTT